MNTPRLPQELLDIILHNLQGHTAALARCTIVSSHLYPLAEKLLYRKFTIGPPVRSTKTKNKITTRPNLRSARHLLTILTSKPYIAQYIHEIIITNQGPLFTWLDRKATNWLDDRDDDTIGKILFALTHLRSLSLIGVVSHVSGADDGYLDWFRFSGAFRLTMFWALTKVPTLERIRLENIDNVPLVLFGQLPRSVKELVLQGVTWAPPGYTPPEWALLDELLEHSDAIILWNMSRELGKPVYPEERKPCQLEKLCLYLHDACFDPFASFLLGFHMAPSLVNLKLLHCGMLELEDHDQLGQLVTRCQGSLETFEFFPAWPVSLNDVIDHLDIAAVRKLNQLSLNFFVQADSWGADNWAPWVAGALAKLGSQTSTTPTTAPPITSPQSTSSSPPPSPSSPVTAAVEDDPQVTSSSLQSLHLRLEFSFTEADDIYVNLSPWRAVDNILSSDFPRLQEVKVDVVCRDEGTTPFLESLLVDLRAQFPKVSKKGFLRVQEGPECFI